MVGSVIAEEPVPVRAGPDLEAKRILADQPHCQAHWCEQAEIQGAEQQGIDNAVQEKTESMPPNVQGPQACWREYGRGDKPGRNAQPYARPGRGEVLPEDQPGEEGEGGGERHSKPAVARKADRVRAAWGFVMSLRVHRTPGAGLVARPDLTEQVG